METFIAHVNVVVLDILGALFIFLTPTYLQPPISENIVNKMMGEGESDEKSYLDKVMSKGTFSACAAENEALCYNGNFFPLTAKIGFRSIK